MRTTAIVWVVAMMAAAVVAGGCATARRDASPAPTKSQAALAVGGEELAAERALPKRTNARKAPERVGPTLPPETPTTAPAKPAPKSPTPTTAPADVMEPARPAKTNAQKIPEDQISSEAEDPGATVLAPSQGRPIMLTPGDTFYFVMRLRQSLGSRIVVSLVHCHAPELRFPVRADVPPVVLDRKFGQMTLKVPDDAVPGLYHIEVKGRDETVLSRNSVLVTDQWKARFRMVHLSNMNIDDPAAPEFDELLIDEINLLAPDFVVCTGDFTQWGRALSRPQDWVRTLDFLAKIKAPAYLVCGDHDHEESFVRYVADNPIGTLDYGNYHGILLLDHSAHRIDRAQLRFLKNDLAKHRNIRGFNFLVMHNDELDVLDLLRQEVPDLDAFVKEHKLRMIITGGHVDWDGKEFAGKLKGLRGDGNEGLLYIRTHQSSTCMQDRATGISHYRVIEIDGRRIDYAYPDDTQPSDRIHSIPVGRVRVFYAQPNDGSQERVVATVQNALNREFADCRVWLKVAKSGDEQPAAAGGKLVRAIDSGTHWTCEIRVDLPDKGGVKVMAAGRASLLPPPLPVDVKLLASKSATTQPADNGPKLALGFKRQTADVGLTYYRSDQKLALVLRNQSAVVQEVWPVVRLNGEMLPIDYDAIPHERKPLTIQPGGSIQLPIKLVLGRLSEGPHQLQIHFRSDPLKRVSTFPAMLSLTK